MKMSFKYCRICLAHYYNNPVYENDDIIRFFIPTIDDKMQRYVALAEISYATKQALSKPDKQGLKIVDLSEVGNIIHLEPGTMQDPDRLEVIDHFYRSRVLLTHTMHEGYA